MESEERKVPVAVKTRLTNTIVRMCRQDLRPFAFVEGQGFASVAQELLNTGAQYGSSVDVGDVLSSAWTVSRHVEDEYEKAKKHVKEELQQCPDCVVTTDLWAEERTKTHYITITVHYLLDWTMVNRVLATREILGVKTHDNIRRTVESILQHVFDHLDEQNPQDSIIINLFRDAKTLVTHFKRTGLQKALDRSLKQAVVTWWNTRLAMLQSVRDALQSGKLHEVLLHRNELRYVNNLDPDLLEDIIQLLEPSDEATRHLSSDQKPTLHLVLPTKATLLKGLLFQKGDSVIVREVCIQKDFSLGKVTKSIEIHIGIDSMDDYVKERLKSWNLEELIPKFEDLFAYDAKYHRSCLGHYISEGNISAARNKYLSEKKLNEHERAFTELTEELTKTVFSKDMTVTTLNAVTESYSGKLSTAEGPAMCKSWKLKEKLRRHYGDKLIFIERPGKSDLICSSAITVGHAMKEASVLREKLAEDREPMPPQRTETLTDTQILHKAAGILRKSMEEVRHEPRFYIGSDKLSLLQCSKYVPDTLYDFVNWCVSSDAFRKVQSCNEDPALKDNLSVITFCHDLIAQCCSRRTPITLGLGIMIHHEFGSKALINKLHMMGHCVSYDEVRQFLTSAAADQLQSSKHVYIPNGLTRSTEHRIIDAAIDNFDQNEETLDGKNTTHCMAIVVYRRGDDTTAHNPIKRVPEKSLTALNSLDDEVQRYITPSRRPEPPAVEQQVIKSDSTKSQTAEGQDLLWKISRVMKEDKQRIPGWSAFNAYISTSGIPIATVQYMPFIRASPSDLSTIYTVLLKLTQLAEELGQSHILVIADLAIYSKAQQVLWSKPEALEKKVTMRMGGMHITMAFLASIGKLYGDGGLFNIITESDVYAEATARQMLQGKQLARGIRCIKLVSEALFRLFWIAMVSWLDKQGLSPLTDAQKHLLRDVQHAFCGNDQVSARQFLNEVETDLPDLRRKIQQFSESGVQQSATFKYWLNFIKGADLLLRMLRSERDANFELHLNCMSEAIPWFWAAGRMNYAKYLPVYIAEMKALEKSQPDSYKFMKDGGFVVRRVTCNCVATDQALEQTINREGKSQGGIVGFTLRKGALKRWLITRHVTSEYCDAMTELCDGAAHAP
ncbi:hypothetical protein ABVT39_009485 [Epinephelus coioides]